MLRFDPDPSALPTHPAHRASPRPATTLEAFWHSIAAAWRCLAQRRAQRLRNRRDRLVLSQLDDWQLKDIGLTRDQIESVLDDRIWTDCFAARSAAETVRRIVP